ncbi:SGNH/GDSL hydrolase family protein [Reyranella sp.]|uniref:SGNH/GDSL hydrolase family protein n=1 Tax=Reyranella sp. TaxID=1929291 RepID=UPI003BABC11C
MAALAETRDVGSTLALPASVRRICCLGDSITYGQGVAPRQTLAMHVARFANIAYPDQIVWVDNRGESSGNIWHAWAPFARLLDDVRYDAAILSICQNDAQIFESNSVRYGEADGRKWVEDGALAPLLQRTVADLAQTAARHGLCLLLDFYTLWDSDAPLIEAVSRECDAVGLPFVDLLQFLREESGLSAAEFVASPFDGHPSDSGHHAAARRLVEELRRHWQPPADPTPVAERLLAACDEAMRAGWAADDILHWALLVLDAKEIVSRRNRGRHPDLVLGDLAGARAAIEDRYRGWYARHAAAAQAALDRGRRDELWTTLDRAYTSVRNLGEIAFVLERFHEGPVVAELWDLLARAGYYTAPGRLSPLPADLAAHLLAVADASATLAASEQASFGRAFHAVRRDFERNLRALAALLSRERRIAAFDANALRLWQVAHNLVTSTWTSLEEFARATSGTAAALPPKPVLFTTVDVRVERNTARPRRGGLCNLTVEIDYIEPLRARRSDKLWASMDEDTYAYRFEVPLLLLGDVGIGVPAWDDRHKAFLEGDLRLARVEIGNFRADATWTRRSFLWQPPEAAPPLHWLKLDRLALFAEIPRAERQGTSSPIEAQGGLFGKIRTLWSP